MQKKNPFDQFDDQAQPRTFGAPDPTQPYKVPEVQSKIANTQTDTATANAKLPYVAPQAAADVKKATAEAQKITQDTSRGPSVDEARTKAINAYWAAMQLGDQIQAMRDRFQEGPGSTSGIWGLEDYFPTTANQRFDTAANTARGNVGNAFGFTGSQLNTPSEVSMNIGPYLPSSWDKDQVARDKMDYLQGLRDRALKQAVAQLGGIPDQNGKVTPVPPGWNPSSAQNLVINPGNGGPPSSPGGGNGPERPDGSAPIAGGTSGGNTMSLSPGDYTTKLVDPPAVAKASFSLLMKGKPTDDQMRQWGAKFGYDVGPYIEARQKNPGVSPTLGKTIQRIPLSTGGKIWNSVGQSPVGAGAIAAGNAVTGGWLDNMTSDPEQTRAIMGLSRQTNPNAAFAGDVAGSTLAAYGGELALGAGATKLGLTGAARFAPLVADTLYGAANGAGNADEGSRLAGAAMGATLGAGFGAAGRGVARGTGNAFRGIRDASVQYLNKAGVPMTVGQAVSQSGWLGKTIKGLEDRASGFSGVGDIIKDRQTEGYRGFNNAAFREGGAPIGFSPTDIGEQGIDAFKDASGQAYRGAVDGVSVSPDAQFAQDVGGALSRGGGLPRVGPEFNSVVGSDIAPHFAAPTGAIDGPQIQDLLQNTRGTPFGTDAMGAKANGALSDIGGAVSDLVGRQAPDVIPKLRAANTAYRNLNILADAVGRGANTDGLFTPAQLGMSARANATKFGGKLAAASEDRPFFDLQRAGQNVLPSKVPDSGTAGRLAMLAVPTLAGGGIGSAGGYAAGDTSTGAGAGSAIGLLGALALAAGGSRAGQRILTKTLLDRPDFAVKIGDKLIKKQGLFGAPMVALGQQLLPR